MAAYEIVLATICGSIFGLMGLLLINRNWFKKMRFKTELDLLKAKNRLEIKKLEKSLNLNTTDKTEKSENSAPNLLAQIAPLLKNLDGDQIAGLIETFTGGGAPETENPEGLSGLLENIIRENPELVSGFLQGFKNKGGGSGATPPSY